MKPKTRHPVQSPDLSASSFRKRTIESNKPYNILDLTGSKNHTLKKISDLANDYPQKIGWSGILFHDRNGCLVTTSNHSRSRYNIENTLPLKNIDSLWKTQWHVYDEEGQTVTYENSPFMRALQTGKTCKELLRVQTLGGKQHWLYFHSQPFQAGDSRESFCIVSNIIDVTNEKIILDSIEKKETLLHSYMKHAPGLSWIVNEDGDLLFASEAFYRYFGLKQKTSIGKKLVDLVPLAVSSKFYTKHLRVFDTGKPLQTTKQIRFADGTNFMAYVSLFPLEGPEGKRMVAGLSMNLPQNKMIAKLREAKDKLLMLSHATSDAIWEWDMQSGHIYRNQPLMKMIGYENAHFTGLTWWLRHIHPDDRERISQRVKEAAEQHKASWQEQYRFLCANGHYMHVQDRGYVIYENGLAVRMIGSLTDITTVKELETELANERMKRETELAETVIRVQEMERTRFGHELHDNVNQILSSAKLFFELIKSCNNSELEYKQKGMDYIMLAIEEIRKLSRELVVPQLKQKGLAESIRGLIDDMHITSRIKFSFIHDPESEFESVHQGKKVTLYRIVQEQVKNILKHSKATLAGIGLRVTDAHLQLVIWDNGVGFVPRKMTRGIGLSNIRERVSFFNGRVDIKSAPGQGTELVVTMPVA